MTPPTRLPAASSRRVRDRVARAAAGPVRVLHRGPHSIYLDLDGWCLGIVDALAAQVPCALRTTSLTGIAGESAHVGDGLLHLDGVPVTIGRIVDVTVPTLRHSISPSQRASREPRPESWASSLVGRGDGLTPYGDDVLCGWFAIHRAAGVETPEVEEVVRARLGRTTLLSATLLECAMHGEVLPEFAAWVRALGTPAEPTSTAALEAVGHTSGRGLIAGARRGLHALAATVAA